MAVLLQKSQHLAIIQTSIQNGLFKGELPLKVSWKKIGPMRVDKFDNYYKG